RDSSAADGADRRHVERRRHVLRALIHGSFRPRRLGPRRADECTVSAVDWHHPQWLAIAILIVAFSCTDALLTLMLTAHGGYEANPLMGPLVAGNGLAFALVKIGLPAVGVVFLTLLARIRAFGRIPVGLLLYSTLALYGALIYYEYSLLGEL